MNWYQFSHDEILSRLEVSEKGLSDQDVRERQRRYGFNRLPEERGTGLFVLFMRQFASPLIYILLFAAVITAVLKDIKDTIVISAVLIFNAVIGFSQEHRAEESVKALKKMMVPKARVLREGREREVNSEELVPGDIVFLASGSKVPADLRLLSAMELKIDEAMLTGESVPAEKNTLVVGDPGLAYGDQRNMAFMGTVVVNGRGRGVVVETGSSTVLGSIAEEVRTSSVSRIPLKEKFDRFSNRLGLMVLGASAVLLAAGILVGEDIKGMFMTVVAAAVATVPEGLPIVLTVALAAGVRRMARRNAIIRLLPAVETLGSTTVICTDKTGTLTRNEMTVRVVYDGEHVFEVKGSGYEPKGEILHEWVPITEAERHQFFMCFRVGLLCNESDLYEEGGQYRVDGDPTEGALIVSAMKAGLNVEEERERYQRLDMIPFESDRGYMATLHRCDSKKMIFVKGAPEKILDLCVTCFSRDELRTQEILRTSTLFAQDGMRVLAMAYKEAPDHLEQIRYEDVEGDLTLAGLQGMIDPPRTEAIEAVEGCRRAGIRVVMITGDHPVTALAIGRMLGIAGGTSEVLTGRDLEGMSDEELYERVGRVSIYARVSPHHKMRIVNQIMKKGDIVAVTGDGVNDAPALKAAHIGVAMGGKGTDVAKEASDMVITDDNFATIFKAVEEGRVVFDNIRKVVFFLIPTGVAAIGSIIGCVFMGVPIPYTPSQLLWINLVTNGFQVIALVFEPGEKDVVERPPRDPSAGIMSRVLTQRTVLVGFLISAGVVYTFIHALQAGLPVEEARTIAMTTMVFFQFFQAWNSRSEYYSVFRMSVLGNPLLAYGLMASVFAHLAAIYTPPFQWLLETVPLSLTEWVGVIAVSVTVILVVEVDKIIRRKRNGVVEAAIS